LPEVDSELNELLTNTYKERTKEKKQGKSLDENEATSDKQKKVDMINRLKNKENLAHIGQVLCRPSITPRPL
jgi:hypothetical protein